MVLILLVGLHAAQAQTWKLAIGSNITQYQFKNSAGQSADLFKKQSGLHLDVAYEHVLLDTVRLISKFSKSLELLYVLYLRSKNSLERPSGSLQLFCPSIQS
jgi:hypothetical protein